MPKYVSREDLITCEGNASEQMVCLHEKSTILIY